MANFLGVNTSNHQAVLIWISTFEREPTFKQLAEIKKYLCTRQISQNPYPIRVLRF